MRKLCNCIASLSMLLFLGLVNAGDIIPGIDDAEALFDSTSSYDGANSISAIEGSSAGYITLAARFSASQQDMSASGAVVILECGGTSFGNGLYLCGGDMVFMTKGSSGGSGNENVQSSLNDTDVSDNAAAVTLGAVAVNEPTEVFASYDVLTGELYYALNGDYGSVSISGTSGSANLSGNESVTFLGPVPSDRGWLGGQTNVISVSNSFLDARETLSFTGVPAAPVRGQIFAIPAPEKILPYSVVVSKSGQTINVQEGGYSDSLSIFITDNPGDYPVAIRFIASDLTQIIPGQVEFTFDSSNWQPTREFIVNAVDDSLREARYHELVYNIEVITDTGSPYYGKEFEPVTVKILENDCGTWAGYTEGDFNDDCQIDIQDLYLLALEWMDEL